MEYMKIGHTDINASAITFGAMPIGGGTWWSGSDDKVSIDTIHRAYDLGINTIDTAPIYGLGHSEEVVGKAIAGQRDKYVISTKATFDWDTGEGRFWHEVDGHKVYVAHGYKDIIKDCENSLKRLGTDYIDIYYTHNPVRDPAWLEKYPVEDTVRALMDLKKAGKIRCIGSSNVDPEHIEAYMACGCEIDIIQRKYTILARGVEENILPICEKYGMTFHAYAPIERGLLTGTVTKDRVVPPRRRPGGSGLVGPRQAAPRHRLRGRLEGHLRGVPLHPDRLGHRLHPSQQTLCQRDLRRPEDQASGGRRGHCQCHPPGRHGGGDPPPGRGAGGQIRRLIREVPV